MPRACLIVLDAVGVGDLPDAERYGTARSNTLGHVAAAVGGLELPSLQQLGLGNVLPLAGCPPRAISAPAVWGRLVERSQGMDTTTGHWEMVGDTSPSAGFPTFPDGFPAAAAGGVPRAAPAAACWATLPHPAPRSSSSWASQHQRSGELDRLHLGRQRVPACAAHEQTVPSGGAVCRLPGGARAAHRRAGGRPRDRTAVRGRPRARTCGAPPPPRLLAAAAAAEPAAAAA